MPNKKGVRCVMKTTDQFKKEVYNKVKDEYTVLGEYTGTNKKILMRHNKCGHEYLVTPNKFLNLNRRCPKCNKRIKKNNTTLKKELLDLGIDYIEILGEYKNYDTPIRVKNLKCGHEYNGYIDSIKNEKLCPICRGYIQCIQDFQNKLDDKGLDFTVISTEYINKNTPIKLQCNKCGNIIESRPSTIIQQGIKCTCQKCTVPELEICNYLEDLNLDYKMQYTFNNLKNKRTLYFDFMTIINGKVLIIEYDGEFHFGDSTLDIVTKKLDQYRENDNIKNEYCINNKIQLLRIPYWSRKNKNEIISKVIKLLESSTTIQKWSTIEAYWKREADYLLL